MHVGPADTNLLHDFIKVGRNIQIWDRMLALYIDAQI